MKQASPRICQPAHRKDARERQHGVALIIVLGFLGLMVMMAVAYMVQARVERMVADSTLEGIRARQIAQTGIAAAIQDYLNYTLGKGQADPQYDLFLSGQLSVSTPHHYFNPSVYYDSTNLWNGEAADWLPMNLDPTDEVEDMEWIAVREKRGDRSRILGRYAYACFRLSGGVDANLLGRNFKSEPPANGYGAQTNRNNVRKMVLNSVQPTPSTDRNQQIGLYEYQSGWQGFDTPAALAALTDGKVNDGDDGSENRWAYSDSSVQIDEKYIDYVPTDHLSCYSYTAIHPGSGAEKKVLCTADNIVGHPLLRDFVTTDLGGSDKDLDNVKSAIRDYMSDSKTPEGTDYPSVKDVPMFNEIQVAVTDLKKDETSGEWLLTVTVQPEFWCPFPSQDNADNQSYTLTPPKMTGGNQKFTPPPKEGIYVTIPAILHDGESKISSEHVLTQKGEASPPSITVEKSKCLSPTNFGPFTYTLVIDKLPRGMDGVSPVNIKIASLQSILFNGKWSLKLGGTDVDATPEEGFEFSAFSNNRLTPDNASSGISSQEINDPRLNHLAGLWKESQSTSGSMNKMNTVFDLNPAKNVMNCEASTNMYCRNGAMVSPAELGYIPFYKESGGTPWVTLNIFTNNGIELMNTLVCDTNVMYMLNEYKVFYTNGNINPNTRDIASLNGAFHGLDIREVPNMPGEPNGTTDIVGKERARELAQCITNNLQTTKVDFIGPGGWSRVLLDKALEYNKNQRVALAHNTWGLFTESDSLFLVYVVAQSISEAPEAVDAVGNFNPKEDAITGERWAVALCWVDTSQGVTDNEMDIIMFKYLNE